MKKKSNLSSEKIRHKAVKLAKQIIRKQHNYTCEYCDKREPQVKTHGSHIYPEGTYHLLSAELKNILCLCFTHHTGGWNSKEPSWHKNPVEMIDWFNEKYSKRAKELKKLKQKSFQGDLYYWTKKLEDLQNIWETINQKQI